MSLARQTNSLSSSRISDPGAEDAGGTEGRGQRHGQLQQAVRPQDLVGADNGQKDTEKHDPAKGGEPTETAAVQFRGEEGEVRLLL